ncbi:MAG TPA: protein phosphatase 2C domain-containing protein [Bryobacteraceae bacterium]
MKWFGASDVGRRRGNNEDAWQVEGALNAAILADGMGGENCGEVGSAITVETIADYLRKPEDGLTQEELAKEAIREANRRVLETARRRQECDGMGSTVVLVLWRGSRLVVANVGDSRAYLYRAGDLRQLSYDQNFANELRMQLGLSEERVRELPNGHVLTMAVGTFDHILIRTHTEEMQPGDQILICSDGLHGPVDHATIAQILGEAGELEGKVERLIGCANERGGPDNVTAILLEYANG